VHVLVQEKFEEPDDPASLDHEPLVVHQRTEPTHNQALIIFVHGLGGRRYGKKATWGHFPGYVYEDFQQLDVGQYAFHTLLGRCKFWESVSLETEAEVLAGIIRDGKEYRKIILVGHSMGGLLCMGAICHALNTRQPQALKRLGGLILMATPQTGSQRVPKFLSWFSKDFYALRPHGDFVTRLHETFVNTLVLDEGYAPPDRTVLPTWAVLGASDF
jgi:pimeloyl-ACP methyl ester carboxylesterase